MSRIGKKPIKIPDGVEVKNEGGDVVVKGLKGTLRQRIPGGIKVDIEGNEVKCSPMVEDKTLSAKWGLCQVLIENMITGVSAGFSKDLEIVGVGYKAESKGKDLNIHVGFSHPVMFKAGDGISFSIEGANKVTVTGIDKQKVGQVAAEIRGIRPPEPYKGKGVRYAGEKVKKKAGKTGIK